MDTARTSGSPSRPKKSRKRWLRWYQTTRAKVLTVTGLAVTTAVTALMSGLFNQIGVGIYSVWRPSPAATHQAVSPSPSPLNPSTPTPAPNGASAAPASAAPTATGGRPAGATAPAQPPAVAGNPPVTASGVIESPNEGTSVPECSYFSGTSRLAPGKTLILAMRNVDNGDSARYVEYVFGWRDPSRLGFWRGAQYFGGAEGQHYKVQLIVVGLDAAQAASTRDAAALNALADQGDILTERSLVRVAGTVPNNCAGP